MYCFVISSHGFFVNITVNCEPSFPPFSFGCPTDSLHHIDTVIFQLWGDFVSQLPTLTLTRSGQGTVDIFNFVM